MSVDMFERRFRQELNKVAAFQPIGQRNEQVWQQEFPAWRALFTSLCLYGHSTGYRLFSYEHFFSYCENAYCKQHPNAERFLPYFRGDLLQGMRERIGVWYESGMSEVYLYVCLVEVLEDKLNEGVVIYDPRVDWKLKGDVMVIMHGQTVMVSAYHGDADARPHIERKRDRVERVRKVNSMESAHWKNKELKRMQKLEITRTETDCQMVNGVRLFSLEAINDLLREIYNLCGVADGYLYSTSDRR
jgi:hypothetical protein